MSESPRKAKTTRGVTVADLSRPEIADRPANLPRAVLRCPTCGETYSACAGDYFMLAPTETLICCRRQLRLVVPIMVYQPLVLEG